MSPSNAHIQPAAADGSLSPDISCSIVKRPLPRGRTNISRACMPCRQRKRKCTGTQPCSACDASGSACTFDATMDRRRRSYGEKARAEVDFQKGLLENLLNAIKTEHSDRVLTLIRANASMEELAAELETISNRRRASTCSTTSSNQAQLVVGRTLTLQSSSSRGSFDTPNSPGDAQMNIVPQSLYSVGTTKSRPPQQALPSFDELTASLPDPTLEIASSATPESPGYPQQRPTYHAYRE